MIHNMEENKTDIQENIKEDENKENNEATSGDESFEGDIPILDLTDHAIKQDQFEGIHILDDMFEKIEGAPNFRKIEGFPIYGTGQPTADGMVEIIKRAKTGKGKDRIVWFNMRQEPVVYVNGFPFAPRSIQNPHMNLEDRLDSEEIRSVEGHLARILKKRLKEGDNGTIVIHQDREFAENPMERVDIEVALEVKSIEDYESVYNNCREMCNVELKVIHVPVIEEQMTTASNYDIIVEALKDEQAATPCVFSCQMGKGRTTLGMVSACLVKQVQLTTELR